MSAPDGPAIALITPVLNRAGMIAAALASAAAQLRPGDEHVVADGGSTDGTQAVVARFPGVRLLAGPDRGLYDAIDIGVAVTSAPVIGLINSDDLLEPGALARVRAAFAAESGLDMASGGALYADEAGHAFAAVEDDRVKALSPAALITGVPIINARFASRALHARLGGFDLRFPVVADRDWLLRAAALRPRNAVLPERLYRYRWHPGSLTVFAHAPAAQNARDLAAARLRLDERHGGALGAAYRDWHAWTTGYGVMANLRTGRPGEALALAGEGLRRDPAWPARFAPLLAGHLASRRARRSPLAMRDQPARADA